MAKTPISHRFPDIRREAVMMWIDCMAGRGGPLARADKPWPYVLITHDEILKNMMLEDLVARFGVQT